MICYRIGEFGISPVDPWLEYLCLQIQEKLTEQSSINRLLDSLMSWQLLQSMKYNNQEAV